MRGNLKWLHLLTVNSKTMRVLCCLNSGKWSKSCPHNNVLSHPVGGRALSSAALPSAARPLLGHLCSVCVPTSVARSEGPLTLCPQVKDFFRKAWGVKLGWKEAVCQSFCFESSEVASVTWAARVSAAWEPCVPTAPCVSWVSGSGVAACAGWAQCTGPAAPSVLFHCLPREVAASLGNPPSVEKGKDALGEGSRWTPVPAVRGARLSACGAVARAWHRWTSGLAPASCFAFVPTT